MSPEVASGRLVRQLVEPRAGGDPGEEGAEIREDYEHVHRALRPSSVNE